MTKVPELLITHGRLVHNLRQLDLRPGQVVMLYASVKTIGWVVGGPDVVLQALLDVLTPAGTLVMYEGALGKWARRRVIS